LAIAELLVRVVVHDFWDTGAGADAEAACSVRDDEQADINDDDEEKIPDWIRCSPADLYFKRDSVIIRFYHATLCWSDICCHHMSTCPSEAGIASKLLDG